MTLTDAKLTPQDCFEEAAKALRQEHPNAEVAREWRQLGDAIATTEAHQA